ncbi:SIS domain-containing protein [Neobacillus sp. NPDC093127]|uniref:SIS domain-containing protein n=1 Tax=Neobacillus sp. NPDC093127 TaxID=3364296 RepID=UPI00381BCE46
MSRITHMFEEVKEQADLLTQGAKDIEQQVKDLVAKYPTLKKTNKIFIVGCGDSYYAGIACQQLLYKYLGISVEVYQALEFSRYAYETCDENSVVLAVSNSGMVARTVECALRAKEMGALALGITSNKQSPLAQMSRDIIEIKIPPVVGLVPGTRSYAGSMVSLAIFGFVLAEALGRISEAGKEEALAYLGKVGTIMRDTVENNFDQISKYVNEYVGPGKEVSIYHVLGSGPNYATAQFGTMKLLEAAGFESIPQGIEEWAHSQYFVTHKGSHVIFILPKGRAYDRALEVMQAVKVVDGKVIVIAEEDDEEVKKYANFVWTIKGESIREEFTPFVYAVPLEILSFLMAKALNKNPMDFDEKPWKKAENFRQIFKSNIVSMEKLEQ